MAPHLLNLQHVLLGMAATIDGEPSMAPVRTETRISSLIKLLPNGKHVHLTMPDPWHDGNKLFSALRTLPQHQVIGMDLEDLGIEAAGLLQNASEVTGDESCGFVGGNWVSASNVPEASTRIAIAVQPAVDGEKWSVICVKWSDLNSSWDTAKVCDIVRNMNLWRAGAFVLPIMNTLKVERPGGIIYIG
ncbi:hypothetical protein DFJ77DRAFT_452763 [Powellomyces hirtus]|nr:hypothetical protein DFJ77DRAFT_452763 [Powellomyces hirtus]